MNYQCDETGESCDIVKGICRDCGRGQKVVVIDVESTGLYPAQGAKLYEVACGFLEGNERVDIQTWNIDRDLSFQTRLVMKRLRHLSELPVPHWNGDSEELVAHQVKAKLSEFFESSYPGEWFLCAYNAPFESSFMCKKPWAIMPKAWKRDLMIDVMKIMGPAGALQRLEWKQGEYKWPKLETETLPFFGIVNDFPHSAEGDVRAEVEVYLKLLEMEGEHNDL